MPTTIVRTGRFLIPRRRSRSIFSLHASCTSGWICFIPMPLRALMRSAWMPCSLNHAIQRSVQPSSARSALFKRTIRPFPFASSSISGLRLPSGTRASTSSITRSISLISSFMALFAFVICPGYHCICMKFSSFLRTYLDEINPNRLTGWIRSQTFPLICRNFTFPTLEKRLSSLPERLSPSRKYSFLSRLIGYSASPARAALS